MLVLTRKKSELIQIGENIVIKVIRTSAGSVKIGIDAPNDVRIMRGELDEELCRSYDVPVSSTGNKEKKASNLSEALEAALSQSVAADCRPGELVDDEEPVSLADFMPKRNILA